MTGSYLGDSSIKSNSCTSTAESLRG
uniref:Uncharacterized protein n=1 Tax=Arundo donax TaxID=35708 RepID=A0A0A8YGB4_ARUDO